MERPLPQQAEAIATLLSRLTSALAMPAAEDPLADLPIAQWRVCKALRDGPRTMTSLSKELHTSQSAVTQTADRLERVGMIERVLEDDDRRVRLLRLTARGAALLQARRAARTRRLAEALAILPDGDRAVIGDALQTLLDASLATRDENPAAADG